jgi:hypothetical protein
VTELEQQLVALGAALDVPPAPDVVPGVLARLPARAGPSSRQPRVSRLRRVTRPPRVSRPLAVVLAAVLLLAGGAMAVPATRHAILRVLGLRGVQIERVGHLPPSPAGARLGLGERVPLAKARHAAGFIALLPSGAAEAYVKHDVPGGRISLLIGHALIVEFRGTTPPFIFKVLGPGTTTRHLRVNGGPGLYLSGAPHQVMFQPQNGQIQVETVRLAGNVLIWQQGPVTVRIEGARTLTQALTIARSLR